MNEQRVIAASPAPVLFSAEDYLAFDRTGALDRYAKTELIEGVIVAVNAQYSRHARIKSVLYRRLADACDASAAGVSAWVEGSLRLSPDSVPQPDILVTTDWPDDGLASIDVVKLLVEVADSSLKFDLGLKAALYASACVPEYWVIDVNAWVIYQMWSPADGAYAERRQVAFGEPITAAAIPGLTVATDRLA